MLTQPISTTFHPSQVCGYPLPYDSLDGVRERLGEVAPNLVQYGKVEEANYFKQASELTQVCGVRQVAISGCVALWLCGFVAVWWLPCGCDCVLVAVFW